MPPWILPGRRDNTAMRYKAILETSLAFSRIHNPRNIEYFWYPLWDQTLSDLVADVPNLVVAQQFPVWIVPADDNHEDENGGDDPEEIVVPVEEQEARRGSRMIKDKNKDGDNGDLEIGVGDISFASTVPEKDARGVLVDFAILNLTAVTQPLQKERYGGWRITAASVGLLVEVKRFPSRSLTGREQESQILESLAEAKNELIEQAGYLFLQDTNMDSVLAIAATGNYYIHISGVHTHDLHFAGPYWSGTTICRGDVDETMRRLSAKDPSYLAPGKQGPDRKLKWNNALRIDVPRSRNRLRTIYNTLTNMGVLEVPADV
jgi:hypothetical protein